MEFDLDDLLPPQDQSQPPHGSAVARKSAGPPSTKLAAQPAQAARVTGRAPGIALAPAPARAATAAADAIAAAADDDDDGDDDDDADNADQQGGLLPNR